MMCVGDSDRRQSSLSLSLLILSATISWRTFSRWDMMVAAVVASLKAAWWWVATVVVLLLIAAAAGPLKSRLWGPLSRPMPARLCCSIILSASLLWMRSRMISVALPWAKLL